MGLVHQKYKVAVVQAAPVWLDLDATVDKTIALIEQAAAAGAKLIGQYDSSVAFGQSRVLLVWTRVIMPDGGSIVLERQPGADTGGYAGLEDEVDNHWGVLFKAAVLSTLLSVGSEAGATGNQNDLVQAIRRGGSESFNQVGQRVVSRNLDIQPTLTIRPGFPVRVIVNRDLVLAPYQQEAAR